MTTLVKEESKVEVFKTNVEEVDKFVYSSPELNFFVFMKKGALNGVSSLKKAREKMSKRGYRAYSPQGIKKLQGHEYSEKEDFVDVEQDLDTRILYKDFRSQNGFVYQWGKDVPVNRPMRMNLYASSSNLSPELWKQLKEHPWISLEEKTVYVHGNGETWYFTINLPQEEFEKVYLFAKQKKDKHFHSGDVEWALIHEFAGYPDVLGIQKLKEKSETSFDEDDDEDLDRW